MKLFWIIVLIIFSARAESLLFPMALSPQMSSSFGEFRPGHFHAGIDLKTFGKNGIPVRSAHAGKIMRARVNKYGYGKSLYIKNDSFFSVYAHLERFETEQYDIEGQIQKISEKIGKRYPIDRYFGFPELPVKAGEIIGYSGETGAGFPHLHYELRKNESDCVNPLTAGMNIADKNSPIIEGVIFEPVSCTSTVNGIPLLFTSGVTFNGTEYCAENIPEISGKFLLKIICADTQNLGESRLGVYKIEVLENENKVYELIFDEFNYSDYNRVGLVYDLKYTHLSPTRYVYNLYSIIDDCVFNKSVLYSYPACETAGQKSLKIRVYDAALNMTELKVFYDWAPAVFFSPDFRIKSFSKNTLASIYFDDDERKHIAEVYVSKDSKNEVRCDLSYDNFFEAKVPGSLSFACIRVKDHYGRDHYYYKTVQDNRLTSAYKIHSDDIQYFPDGYCASIRGDISFSGMIGAPDRYVTDKSGTSGYIIHPFIKDGKAEERYGFLFSSQGFSEVKVENSSWEVQKSAGKILSYGDFECEAFKNTVYAPAWISIRNFDGKLPEFPLISEPVKLYPEHMPLNKMARVKFKIETEENPRKIGVFKYSSAGKYWSYIKTSVNGDYAEAYISDLSPCGVFADTIFPDAGLDYIYYSDDGKVSARFFVSDQGKGVNEESIILKIDGKSVEKGEYDPDRGWYSVISEVVLKNGTHRAELHVADNADNSIVRKYSFSVK